MRLITGDADALSGSSASVVSPEDDIAKVHRIDEEATSTAAAVWTARAVAHAKRTGDTSVAGWLRSLDDATLDTFAALVDRVSAGAARLGEREAVVGIAIIGSVGDERAPTADELRTAPETIAALVELERTRRAT